MEESSKKTLVVAQPNSVATPSPLRYYDPELQDALNTEPYDADRFQRARAKAKQLNAAYMEELNALASRLSQRTLSLFADPQEPLFDADLFEFSFGDSLQHAAARSRRRALKMTVRAAFGSFDEETLHTLTYRGVKALNVNVPMERWYERGGSRIDSLLSHELTSAGVGLMRHAFLFASGAALSVIFERVRWETKRIR
jgi:hypothetical protein